jgi:hypothetical protein
MGACGIRAKSTGIGPWVPITHTHTHTHTQEPPSSSESLRARFGRYVQILESTLFIGFRRARYTTALTFQYLCKIGDQILPIAQYGDIPAGRQVRITCDVHYCPSAAGEEMPKCLMTGEWEQGKTCEPITCDPYIPPPHGVVVPAGPVRAGEQVTIYCEEGYDEYYGPGETVGKAAKAGASSVMKAHILKSTLCSDFT